MCRATCRRDLSDPADADQHEFITQDNARIHLLNGHYADFNSGGTNFSSGPTGIGTVYSNLSYISLKNTKGTSMLKSLWNDESGVILSAEIVLVGTILVLGMIVGLVELQCAIVGELSDLSSAFGNLDQSYQTSGFASSKGSGRYKARTYGARYRDRPDTCDCDQNLSIICNDSGEMRK